MLQGSIVSETFSWSEVPSLDGGGFLSRLQSIAKQSGLPLLEDHPQVSTWQDSRYVDREKMTETLIKVNQHYDNSLSDDMIQGLREDALFVVTGQQPGLMMGPLFSIYKAWTAIKQAERLSEKTGRRVYPAFWMATEDHDLEEVNRFTLKQGTQFVCAHSELQGPRPPVGRLSLQPYRQQILDFLREHLAHEDCFAELYDAVENMDFSDYGSFFASWLLKMVGKGRVILMDPMMMRELTSPVLADLVSRWPELLEQVRNGAELLEQQGISVPLEAVTLFHFKESVRKSTKYDENQGDFEDGQSPHEMAQAIREHPELYSPSAGIRPVTQDAAFPVLAYVGGPGELKYLWQINGIYEVMGLKRSGLIPRLSATLIDYATLRRAQKLSMDHQDIFRVKQWIEHHESYLDLDQLKYQQIKDQAQQLLSMITMEKQQIDDPKIDKSMASIDYQVNKIIRRLEEKRQQAVGGGRPALESIAEVVFPDHQPQERLLGPASFVARYGWGHLQNVLETLDPDSEGHQLITLDFRG